MNLGLLKKWDFFIWKNKIGREVEHEILTSNHSINIIETNIYQRLQRNCI